MRTLILARLVSLVPLLFIASLLVFALVYAVPGDPVNAILGPDAPPEQYEVVRERLGLDEPLLEQYASWVADAAQGDFGDSLVSSERVSDAVWSRLPVTLSLTFGALVVALVLGLPAGILGGLRPGGVADRAAAVGAALGLSVPGFFMAILLVIPLAIWWGWFPATGYVAITEDPWGWARSITLASVALGTTASAAIARQTRSALIDVMQRDYIRTARAKGLSTRRVVLKHALKNAAAPVVTVLGFQVNALLGGSLIVEQIFALNGLGTLAIRAVFDRNIPMIQGVVVVGTVIVVLVNLAVDVAYGVLNPKVRPG